MSGPIATAGAQTEPTRYAALTQGGRDITGLVTQRSPYRDGAVPYLMAKFYGGSRFDTLIDGLNREVTNMLTGRRRPGHSVFNSNTFPAVLSFYDWKYIQDTQEIVRTIADCADGTIYDATPGQKTSLFVKGIGAGAGAARFLGVNTQLFFGDGFDTKKIMRSARTWAPFRVFRPGDFIIDSTGRMQSVQANPKSFAIAEVEVLADPLDSTVFYTIITLSTPAPSMPANRTCSFSGLTSYVALNGQTLTWQGLPARISGTLAADQIAFRTAGPVYGAAADTGTMVALVDESGTTGATPPVFGVVWGDVVNDGGTTTGVNWTCFASPVQNWGVQPVPSASPSYLGTNPAVSPRIARVAAFPRYWYPYLTIVHTTMGQPDTTFSLLDSNGAVQVAQNGSLTFGLVAGTTLPQWATQIGGITIDGQISWRNYGPLGAWYALNNYGGNSANYVNPCVIVDTNGNLQGVSDVTVAAASGAAAPAWATDPGQTTVDGGVTWICLGPGSLLWSGQLQYAYSAHCIDGSVSTASPITLVSKSGLGPAGGFELKLEIDISQTAAELDKQVDKLFLWRTAQDQSTLILLDEIPNPFLLGNTTVTYIDVSDDTDLNAQILAPIAQSAAPPDATITGPIYHVQRVFAIVANKVVWSGGPDTLTGNGNTAFPPLNNLAYPAQPIALRPVTVDNGGILVFTTDGVWIILGTGTASNPFYTTRYYASVSLLSPNAIEVYNNQVFLMESNGKVSSLAIEYPFNPQTGYNEVGFPIGDQFKKVTTGAISAPLYNPATAYLSWNVQDTGETAMYVADGQVGWFRLGIVMPPEQGLNWSPRAAIAAGTSAVQAIETSPGRSQLLVGPPAGTPGPILCRDATGTVWADNGAAYPAWDVKGVTLLCTTGQWAEIAHVSTKSRAVGKRPTISVLLNEIQASVDRPWNVLNLAEKSNDPPLPLPSKSVFSDRYTLAQNGQPNTGDCIMTRFDYGTQAVGDELLDWAIFASVQNERSEEAAKVGA